MREGEHVRLRVRDSGRGISPEIRSRIFDPYFSTKDKPEGGLGLATVRRIIRGYGGAIHLDSIPRQRSTFDVYLPGGPGGESPAARIGWRPPTAAVREGGLRVLVVEDDPPGTGADGAHPAAAGSPGGDCGNRRRGGADLRPGAPPLRSAPHRCGAPGPSRPELYGALARGPRTPGDPHVGVQRGGAGAEGGPGWRGRSSLPKPFSPDQLKIVIYRAMASSRLRLPRRRIGCRSPVRGDPVGVAEGGKRRGPEQRRCLQGLSALHPSGLTAPEGDPAEPPGPPHAGIRTRGRSTVNRRLT